MHEYQCFCYILKQVKVSLKYDLNAFVIRRLFRTFDTYESLCNHDPLPLKENVPYSLKVRKLN